MDITKSTEPNSDQQNFDDYVAGPKTVTISEVKAGTPDQPVEVHLAEFPGRPFKPSKSMRRVLVAAWGPEASAYKGRKMTLFGDPTVKFGGQKVGGIRISHLSHIVGPLTVALTVTRGKRSPFVVQPIGNDGAKLVDGLNGAKTLDELQAAWEAVRAAGLSGDKRMVQLKESLKAKLSPKPTPPAALDPADPAHVDPGVQS